jgi:hypothetical protein
LGIVVTFVGDEIFVDTTGDVTGVVDAMVPPTPARDVPVLILRGAFLVIEHDVGGMLAAAGTRAGLWGEPIAMTKGMLELDAALSFRSDGDESWAGGKVGGELAASSRMFLETWEGTTRTLDASESLRDRIWPWRSAC